MALTKSELLIAAEAAERWPEDTDGTWVGWRYEAEDGVDPEENGYREVEMQHVPAGHG